MKKQEPKKKEKLAIVEQIVDGSGYRWRVDGFNAVLADDLIDKLRWIFRFEKKDLVEDSWIKKYWDKFGAKIYQSYTLPSGESGWHSVDKELVDFIRQVKKKAYEDGKKYFVTRGGTVYFSTKEISDEAIQQERKRILGWLVENYKNYEKLSNEQEIFGWHKALEFLKSFLVNQ